MLDPGSLNSLLPSPRVRSLHELATRHIWYLLTLSVISNLCHLVLFFHVRSTAPSHAEIPQGRPKVLFYYVKEREDTERDSLLHQSKTLRDALPIQRQNSNDSLNRIERLERMTNEFMLEIQSRLKKAKLEWTKRLDDYRMGSGVTPASSSQDLIQRPLTPFRVLLQLFAYEEVLKNGRLDAVYDMDGGEALMFFVPQLLSFLLHGAFESSPQLEEWVLDTCRRNVYFAHRCYWFLRAWCLEANESSESYAQRLSRPSSLASFADLEDAGSAAVLDTSSKSLSKFLPEERAVLERLLVEVLECGESPARLLALGSGHESEPPYSQDFLDPLSPSALVTAAEAGIIPIDPRTGGPSVKHWDCVSAPRKFGFLPLDRALTSSLKRSRSDESFFDATPSFLDALLNMANGLFQAPQEQRPHELKRQLRLIEVQFLPSNAIYIPLQNVNHRVWRIVPEESIAINTKERVPCIICLEVVDFGSEEYPARNLKRLLEQVANKDSPVMVPDLKSPLKEKDLVNEWRHGFREPHRQDTPLEKLAYTMRDGIRKIPIDQMKKSMQAQIEKLRDTRTNLQDFWSISVPETFEDDEVDDEPAHRTLESLPSTDIERGEPAEDIEVDKSGSASKSKSNGLLSQSNSSQHTAPPSPPRSPVIDSNRMGQWTSPHYANEPPIHGMHVVSLDDENIMMPFRSSRGPFQRLDSYASNASEASDHSQQGYGSSGMAARANGNGIRMRPPKCPNVDGRKTTVGSPIQESGKTTTLGGSSRASLRPPPVVFKENWREKEERLRSKSAYGSHPGWRLLPILVKANDDLRQEQLASQLIYRMSLILAREHVPVWLCPYEILALTDRGGIIEAIPDTISIASLKKNDPNFTNLRDFFHSFFEEGDDLASAKANFCESLAAYSIVCFLLQIKDRHNGNILLDNRGHLIHIDFGFFFLSSPGKNTGFESAPFKLTRDFVDIMEGPDSHMFRSFRLLCYRAFIALRRHCMEIILLVEMLKKGNEDLPCFRGRPDDAIKGLRERFRLDLNDRACLEYVNALVDDSLENWRTNWYDRYQRYCVGVL